LPPSPKAGAQCGSSARWDLRGGRPATAVPTATGRPAKRGKRDSATRSVCNFLASTRTATCSRSAQRGTTCPRAGSQVRTSKEVSTSERSQGLRSSRRAPATTWRSRRRLSDREGRDGCAIAPSGRRWLLPSCASHFAAARQVAAVRGKAVLSAVANRTVRARVAGTPVVVGPQNGV
jgi:hypothetical protein